MWRIQHFCVWTFPFKSIWTLPFSAIFFDDSVWAPAFNSPFKLGTSLLEVCAPIIVWDAVDPNETIWDTLGPLTLNKGLNGPKISHVSLLLWRFGRDSASTASLNHLEVIFWAIVFLQQTHGTRPRWLDLGSRTEQSPSNCWGPLGAKTRPPVNPRAQLLRQAFSFLLLLMCVAAGPSLRRLLPQSAPTRRLESVSKS